jgi:hypothetical protein
MPFDFSYIIGGTALLWTAFQQYRINKICQDCPYFPPNSEKKIKVSVTTDKK